MRLAYVIYNERPDSGLLRTQVLSLLKRIRRRDPSIDVTLVSFWQPWFFYGNASSFSRMKEELRECGIGFEAYPFALPSRYFLYERLLLPLAFRYAVPLFRSVLRDRFDLVHSRGYFASAVVALSKARLGYRCIFDMRSLFPEEHLSIGTWTKRDKAYEEWKRLEKQTIALSDATVGVSPRMVEDIGSIVRGARAVHIPCCVDTEEVRFDGDARAEYRRRYGWEDRLVVVYVGSMGTSSWNNVHNYARYFSMIRRACDNAYFVLLTPNREIDFGGIFRRHDIGGDRYFVGEAGRAELYKWLSASDVGIHVMSPGADSHTRLGVKFVEYLSCGLPVIINSHVGGAHHYVTKYDVGAVIDIDDAEEARARFARFAANLERYRENPASVAGSHFSVDVCAGRYLDLYAMLMR